MLNKISKYLLPIILVIMVFFINSKDVRAAVKCTWSTRQTYINENLEPVNAIEINDQHGEYGVNGQNVKSQYSLNYDSSKRSQFTLFNSTKERVFSNSNFDTYIEDNGCPKFVIVSALDANGSVNIDVAIIDEVKEYYDNQYKNILSDYSANPEEYHTYYVVNLIEQLPKRSMVLYLIDYKKLYNFQNKHLTELTDIAKKNNEEFIPENFGISSGVTTTEYNFYLYTKDKWIKVINDALFELEESNKCSDGDLFQTSCRSKYRLLSMSFARYFDSDIARLIFEEDYTLFLKCYKFANLYSYNSEEEFNTAVNIFDNVLVIEDASKKKEEVAQNKCISLCPQDISIAKEQCMQSFTYTNCYNSYTNCHNYINLSTAYDACLRANMGESEYSNLNKKYKEYVDSLDEIISEAEDEITDNMKTINNIKLELDGVKFEPYKAKCEDVIVFHIIYKIMTIMAPILVIVFGSLDYAKAVMASDEKKMEESKKKFPKRLLLLVLFVAIPTIISIILSFSNGETTLMHCVINGA